MINTILDRLIGIVQVQLMELSKPFRNIERLAPGLQNKLMEAIMEGIRNGAWHLAERLDKKKTEAGRQLVMEERELWADPLGKFMLNPHIFEDFIEKVVAEENENGISFNVQIVAE